MFCRSVGIILQSLVKYIVNIDNTTDRLGELSPLRMEIEDPLNLFASDRNQCFLEFEIHCIQTYVEQHSVVGLQCRFAVGGLSGDDSVSEQLVPAQKFPFLMDLWRVFVRLQQYRVNCACRQFHLATADQLDGCR